MRRVKDGIQEQVIFEVKKVGWRGVKVVSYLIDAPNSSRKELYLTKGDATQVTINFPWEELFTLLVSQGRVEGTWQAEDAWKEFAAPPAPPTVKDGGNA